MLGFWLARTARKQGLLTEAARAVIDWSFSPAGAALGRIEWRAVVGNVASARAAQALGFHYEGILRLGIAHPDTRQDCWIAGILASDDRAARSWPAFDN
ncbi:GNAT family N-acetyltransferase [Leucobacter viscericola]|uniref:GNAT family N-acetyltransferase n=2 Tax=Leucobacter viscericola TaxID=2714935 RepID=A0A6G7XFP9_9MICO|nr:GNAT family N-acetyltransferase [Leucobacter viscericola]